ncbi:DNA-repair protein [Anaerovibrio sp. JC8]|uniref:DEAD/DEAH box helicase family protein n=1 Tax=Anaerovibrio sp. JC8 TaxID=1240085 RepID=UPI000A0ECA70|nr:DEAD/DEAH box helicase family protein [Anaerovibrio sp. JC8]ORT99294.1 DNA-repair protein [Anaerovibrio sp. JC8]
MINDFSELNLNPSYDSGVDNILWDFYIPVLSKANQYDRIAGFFSSGALAVAAKGIERFILNGGKMRLVTCPRLQGKDIKVLNDSLDDLDNVIYRDFIKSYDEIEDKFEKDHIKALGWMIANGLLEIKIAIVCKNNMLCSEYEVNELGIMHQKVGIFYDQAGNIISFSGSNNESASGWLDNTEEFKVFRSWKGDGAWITGDVRKFNSFWKKERKDVIVKDLPVAIKEKLIEESKDFEPSYIANKKYPPKSTIPVVTPKIKEKLELFYYQEEAVEKWKNNGRKLLLQLATGTGKTRTAIGCIKIVLLDNRKPLIVVACPQVTLSGQWKADIDKLDIPVDKSLVINGNVHGWPNTLQKELLKLSVGLYKNIIIYTTHQVCSSTKFLGVIESSKFTRIKKFFIGDEVHGMGAAKTRNGLIDGYDYRLGLSATPQRWFDDAGSNLIFEYFGNDSYEFTIRDALNNINPVTGRTFLVNYYYHPCFISLTETELQEYKKLTDKIIKIGRYASDNDDFLQMLRFQRANIEKNAENKYEKLENILGELGNEITDTIIFVSDAQIDEVIRLLGKHHIACTKFTQEQGTIPMDKYDGLSERDYIIKLFKERKYQVLVAIKCLDEGIDIPSADTAIIMASSTNPREYVQRIGRIIRQAPGKRQANIYDMILKPDLSVFKDERLIECETRIFDKEILRAEDLSENALNNVSIYNLLQKIRAEVLR